jgi:hypothetical protein
LGKPKKLSAKHIEKLHHRHTYVYGQ